MGYAVPCAVMKRYLKWGNFVTKSDDSLIMLESWTTATTPIFRRTCCCYSWLSSQTWRSSLIN